MIDVVRVPAVNVFKFGKIKRHRFCLITKNLNRNFSFNFKFYLRGHFYDRI